MDEVQRIFLLPGFFGFANLGEIVYFGHVKAFLERELERRGVLAEVCAVLTHPTASVHTRARDALAAMAAGGGGPIHLIGHSTGGLDARLLVAPGAELGDGSSVEALASRVRTVVTVSTPHRGTPLARLFLGVGGQQLMALLSAFTAAVLRRRRIPVGALFRVTNAFLRADDWMGKRPTVLDQVFRELLADFSPERRAALAEFFGRVGQDTSLMAQLTPEAMELFSAVRDRPGVRYGSVVTRAARPTLRSRWASGLTAYAQLTHTLYVLLHLQAARSRPDQIPLSPAHQAALASAYGSLAAADNDGMVPTCSQPYGEVIAAVRGDHLDAIGHFDAPELAPPHYDWLVSGTGFHQSDFEALWAKVAGFVVAPA